MPDDHRIVRRPVRGRLLFVAFGTPIVLTLLLGDWVYEAKNQRELNMKLLGAVRKRDTEAAKRLLADGANLNVRDVPRQQLSLWQLMRIAFHRDSPPDDQKKTLLEMALGLDSVSQLNDESSPDIEHVPLVKALLDAGARTEESSCLSVG